MYSVYCPHSKSHLCIPFGDSWEQRKNRLLKPNKKALTVGLGFIRCQYVSILQMPHPPRVCSQNRHSLTPWKWHGQLALAIPTTYFFHSRVLFRWKNKNSWQLLTCNADRCGQKQAEEKLILAAIWSMVIHYSTTGRLIHDQYNQMPEKHDKIRVTVALQ